jgi:hypothetical protein
MNHDESVYECRSADAVLIPLCRMLSLSLLARSLAPCRRRLYLHSLEEKVGEMMIYTRGCHWPFMHTHACAAAP